MASENPIMSTLDIGVQHIPWSFAMVEYPSDQTWNLHSPSCNNHSLIDSQMQLCLATTKSYAVTRS